MHLADLSPRRGNTMGDPWANRSDILPAGQRLAVRGALRFRSVNQAIRPLNTTPGYLAAHNPHEVSCIKYLACREIFPIHKMSDF